LFGKRFRLFVEGVQMRLLALTLVFAGCGLVSQLSHGNTYSSRQYYGAWQYNSKRSYHYRSYYYKPNKDYYGYKHHYVTYWPKYRQHYYYYNPYQKKYWGRVPTECHGKAQYEHLDEGDRRAEIADIKPESFKKQDKMPNIPESKDEVPMDLPPDDAPPGVVTD